MNQLNLLFKRNFYLAIFIGLISSVFSMSSFAVDGYKELKFGMTTEEVLNTEICTFQSLINTKEFESVKFAACTDFQFGGESVPAVAYFINGEFLRFGIEVGATVDRMLSLMLSLMNKYGLPSTMPSEDELSAVETLPNRKAYIGFDKDTVFLGYQSDENYSQTVFLIYTSPKYETLLISNQGKILESDI